MKLFNKGTKQDERQKKVTNYPSSTAESTSASTSASTSGSVPAETPPAETLNVAMERLSLDPFVSPRHEEVPMWNILPSYQLYEATFSKSIHPNSEDLRYEPPAYQLDREPAPTQDGYFPPVEQARGEPMQTWENSILANTHRMKKLSDIDNKVANHLHVEIYVTEKPGKLGVKPSIIDPLVWEFQQGDNVNGFLTVTNTSDRKLPFDALSVVLEGRVMVTSDSVESKEPSVFYKFLNMFDYSASWTPTILVSDFDLNVDPVDNTELMFPMKRYFTPGITYKRFFNFCIPDKLLDCACEAHNLASHCEAPPTIGLARDQFLKNLRKLRSRPATPTHLRSTSDFTIGGTPPSHSKKPSPMAGSLAKMRDFSFADTSISYSVEVRVVGQAQEYAKELAKSKTQVRGDEFILLNETSCFLRVIPRERLTHEFGAEAVESEARTIYLSFLNTIKRKVELGNDLLSEKTEETRVNLGHAPSLTKNKQLFNVTGDRRKLRRQDSNGVYQVFVPYKKKTLVAPPKVIGLIGAAVPKNRYRIKYIQPWKFRSQEDRDLQSTLELPVELRFLPSEGSGKGIVPPDIKSVSVDIVACTYRSKKYPIPIEVYHDLIFKNKPSEQDNMESLLIKPCKKYLDELVLLTKNLSYDVLDIDRSMIMDVKSIAKLNVKYTTLKVDNVKVKPKQGVSTHWETEEASFSHKMTLNISFSKLLSKDSSGSYEDLTQEPIVLVPSFQSCIIGRLYYLKINAKLQNGEMITLKVPVTIER